MKIHLERSGGFAGVPLTWVVDSQDLSRSDSKALRRIVDGADFFGLPTHTPSAPLGRDAFQYRIVVEVEGQTHAVEGDDLSLPAPVRELVSFVLDRGQRRRQAPQ